MTTYTKRLLLTGVLFFMGTVAFAQQFGNTSDLKINLIGEFHTGIFDEGGAEIAAYDATSQRIFFTNADANTIDILDISNPAIPVKISSINLSSFGDGVNSVAVNNGIVAVAVEATIVTDPGKVVFFDIDGFFQAQAIVGALPDMVTFSPDGTKILVANEGEPNDDYTVDPEGSVSVIDISAGVGSATVSTADFNSFDADSASLIASGVRIFGPGASVSQDLEPEFITISPDGATAFVTLQENNALAVVDIATATVSEIVPLGFKDHSQTGNELDASNRDDAINITNWPVFGMYQPDAIASFSPDGINTYLITANEGDARDYDGFSEETRIEDLPLDPNVFTDATLQNEENLGRLKTTTALADTNANGEYQTLFSYGGRSFSIWQADGTQVYDSGNEFETKLSEFIPDDFNSTNSENDSFDNRSDDKGPEPEAVTVAEYAGKFYAFIGLERVGGVMVYDVTNPAAPEFVTYVTSRNFDIPFDEDLNNTPQILEQVTESGPESIVFIEAADSPVGSPLMVLSNEVTGSVTIYSVTSSILTAREADLGTEISVSGVVTRAFGSFARIQDETGAITVRQTSTTDGSIAKAFQDSIANGAVRTGTYLTLSGETSAFAGASQVNDGDLINFTIQKQNQQVEPQVITLADLADNVGEAFEGELVAIKDLVVTPAPAPGDTLVEETSYTIEDPDGNSLVLRVQDVDETAVIGELIPESTFDFVGIVGQFHGFDFVRDPDTGYQLIPVEPTDIRTEFSLALLHNNDGESQLVNLGGDNTDFGGVARFATLLNQTRTENQIAGRGTLLLSSGDNFLAGPEFTVGQNDGIIYDALAIDALDYDALSLGNHDFDFGPEFTAEFISAISESAPPFLSANTDFSGESDLQALVDAGRIASRTVVNVDGQDVGIIGALTPNLPFISSPGNVVVDADVATAVQAEIDALEAEGVNKIVLISHLQGIQEDSLLATQLSGIDIMIAGGGDELLANTGDLLVPGDEGDVFGPYPITVQNADNNEVPIVTTRGNYSYLGQLIVTFDSNGDLVEVSDESGPIRVAGGTQADAVEADPEIQAQIVDPVVEGLDELASNIIAQSEVGLDAVRANIRSRETNEGNLIADAFVWQANQLAADFGAPEATIGISNGGGIRNDNVIPAGDITELDTFDMLPFLNFVSIVEDITPERFKLMMENAVSRIVLNSSDEPEAQGSGTGRFAQISGFSIEYNPTQQALELDSDGNVVTPGERVISITLDDGTPIVLDGVVVDGAPNVNLATADFTARGGDQYPLSDLDLTLVGVTYQQGLFNYITAPAADGGLDGNITAAQYPEGGEGRINLTDKVAVSNENELASDIPTEFGLDQNYPNPFNPSTNIQFRLPQAAQVTLNVYDMLGRKVMTLVNEQRSAGIHNVRFDASGLASGMYIYRIDAGSFNSIKKMMLIK